MPELIIVVGLPGSGKSYYLKHNAGQTPVFSDVLHPNNKFGPKGIGDVVKTLMSGDSCFIEDVSLCIESSRTTLVNWIKSIQETVEVKEIFFENNPDNCLRNMLGDYLCGGKSDNYFRRLEAFARLFENYVVPSRGCDIKVGNHYNMP